MNKQTPLSIFYCYAHEDKIFREALEQHLSALKRQKRFITWSDREIGAGTEWQTAIDTHLQQAHIILCLISPDFFASNYCYEQEMQQAVQRHKQGSACVIPILVRPTYWKDTPLSTLQMLPSNTIPITLWSNPDSAWLDVVNGILPIIQEVSLSFKTKEMLLEDGKVFLENREHQQALQIFERIIQLDPSNNSAFVGKNEALYGLNRYQEALEAAERAVQLDPTSSMALVAKSATLRQLNRYQEALEAAEQAIQLAPTSRAFQVGSHALHHLNRHQEALEAAEQAVQLDPTSSMAFQVRGIALIGLKRHQEALEAAERAVWLDPTSSLAFQIRSHALSDLGRDQEALEAINRAAKLDPMSSSVFEIRAGVLIGLERYPEALEAAERSILLDPTSSSAFFTKGVTMILWLGEVASQVSRVSNQPNEVTRILNQNFPNSDVKYEERRAEAFDSIEQAILLDPSNILALVAKAGFLTGLGRYQEALEAAEQAIQLDPGNDRALEQKNIVLSHWKTAN